MFEPVLPFYLLLPPLLSEFSLQTAAEHAELGQGAPAVTSMETCRGKLNMV